LDSNGAFLPRFTAGTFELVGGAPLQAHINTTGIYGPGIAEVVATGPHYAEVRLRGLRWKDLDADIDITLYAYAKRLNTVVTVTPRGAVPKLEIGWIGGVRYSLLLSGGEANFEKAISFQGDEPFALALVPTKLVQGSADLRSITALFPPKDLVTKYLYPSEFPGARRVTLAFVAGKNHFEAAEQVRSVARADELTFDVTGGEFRGYQGREGHYRIDGVERTGDEIKVSVRASTKVLGLNFGMVPCTIVVPGADFSAAVLNNPDGGRAGVVPQVVVRKPNGEGRTYTEVYFPLTVSAAQPFEGEFVLSRAATKKAAGTGQR
jgi:hypothetical protein